MKRGIIVQGDSLSSGGVVLPISRPKPNIMNLPFACIGDKVNCPLPFHGLGEIIEGCKSFKINGMPIALQDHKVSCGCTLIASQFGTRLTIEELMAEKEESEIVFDKKFLLKDFETGEIYKNQHYRIKFKDSFLNGRSDENGYTENINSKRISEILNIELV